MIETLRKQRRANKTQGKSEEQNNRTEIESRKTIEESMEPKADSTEKNLINCIQSDQEKKLDKT